MVLSTLRLIAAKPPLKKVFQIGKTLFSRKYLLYTNVIISAHLAAFGDVIQQTYQHSKPDNNEKWDVARTARMFGAGFCLSPFVHCWYVNLDRFLPGNSIRIVLTKMVPDLFLFSPSYIVLFLIVTGILEGQSWKTFKKEVQNKSLSLYRVEITLWTPAQFINFYFLPTRFRVMFDNGVSLIADVLYSYFRFDFEVDDEETESDDENEKENGISQDIPTIKALRNVETN